MNTIEQLIDLSQDLIAAKKITAAQFALSRAYDLSASSVELVKLASLHMQYGNIQGTIDCYEKALKINPKSKEAAVGLSVLYNDLGLYDKGKEVFEQADKMLESCEPERPNSQALAKKIMELAGVYSKSGLYEFALEEGEKALKIDPKNVSYIICVANWMQKANRSDEAFKKLEKALFNHPGNLDIHFALADLYKNKGLTYKAHTVWEQILNIDPNNQKAKSYIQSSDKNLRETRVLSHSVEG